MPVVIAVTIDVPTKDSFPGRRVPLNSSVDVARIKTLSLARVLLKCLPFRAILIAAGKIGKIRHKIRGQILCPAMRNFYLR